jgi:hypothetical protein
MVNESRRKEGAGSLMPDIIDRSAWRSVRMPAPPSLTTRVYEQIRNEIISCALAPGT